MTRNASILEVIRHRAGLGVLGLLIWSAGVGTAKAGISFVDTFRSDFYTQTGNGNSLVLDGSRFDSHLYTTNPNDYTAVSLTYPGAGSPVGLTATDASTFAYQSTFFPNQAALDAAFPAGTYTFSASNNGGTPDTTSINETTDGYAQTLPFLTGTNYSDLQGLNAGSAFTFEFSPFTTSAGTSEADLFFTIRDASTNQVVYDASFQPSSTTSLTVAGGTLLAGHQYTYELNFSDRYFASPTGSAEFDSVSPFDLRTSGTFTTAVPEPATVMLIAQGGLCSGLLFLRRRAIRREADANR